jgi:hypothetical protein
MTIGASDMSTADEDQQALQRQIRLNLATAAAVVVMCLLGIAAVHLIRQLLNRVGRGSADEP